MNNSENDRYCASSEVDERTMREIYLKPFELAVQAQPTTVMCSYNKINGIHASENRYLLKEILRDTFGFQGIVVSDWGACHNRFKSLKATLDLCMPKKHDAFSQVKEALEKGWITEADLDFCAGNVLDFIDRLQKMKKLRRVEFTEEQRHLNAVKVATESMVLLKNEDDVLPLKKKIKTCVIGEMAGSPATHAGGSSEVRTKFSQPHLKDLLSEKLETEVTYECGYAGHMGGLINARAAIECAAAADQVVVVVGEDASLVCEAMNRKDIRLYPRHEAIIENVARVNKNVVVVIEAGSAVDVSPFEGLVKGILYAGYGGDGTNEAIASLLSGETVPCGKLSETFPYSADDIVPAATWTATTKGCFTATAARNTATFRSFTPSATDFPTPLSATKIWKSKRRAKLPAVFLTIFTTTPILTRKKFPKCTSATFLPAFCARSRNSKPSPKTSFPPAGKSASRWNLTARRSPTTAPT